MLRPTLGFIVRFGSGLMAGLHADHGDKSVQGTPVSRRRGQETTGSLVVGRYPLAEGKDNTTREGAATWSPVKRNR
jgi:hypothetical protein